MGLFSRFKRAVKSNINDMISKAENPEDVLTEQGQLVSEFGERLINRAQEFAKIATETQQAVTEWAEEATKKATSGVKTG